jgi:glucose/mannose-6-phosphate isomerase
MLDDLKMVHERDMQDALGWAEKQIAQLTNEFELSGNTIITGVQNIVYGAMGGSALVGQMAQSWPSVPRPFEIVRGYDIPPYVGKDTLFIAVSNSGNTEETLSALEQAEKAGAHVAVIAGGGKLQKLAEDKGYLLAQLPKSGEARFATFYNYRALLQVLKATGILQESFEGQLAKSAQFLTEAAKSWRPDVATEKNPAKQFAQELMGSSVVVYSGPKLYPAACKWKINCNENAKQIAWVNQLPEFNHNEFTGWNKQPIDKPYVVIDIRSSLEHSRVQRRFDETARLLSGMRPEALVIEPKGETVLEQLLWTMVFGDFVTLYLAFLNGLNPTPLPLVDSLKNALNA